MTAKPKSYQSFGWLDDCRFTLTDANRRRLAVLGLTHDDFAWIEARATSYQLATKKAAEKPTPAQVRAALELGYEKAGDLIAWFQQLDDETADTLDHVAMEHRRTGWGRPELVQQLSGLMDILEAARRATGEPQAGNTAKSFKPKLARDVLGRYGKVNAFDILLMILPDKDDSIKRLLRG